MLHITTHVILYMSHVALEIKYDSHVIQFSHLVTIYEIGKFALLNKILISMAKIEINH